MRVAQIAPLFESVPPKKYGGTERVVHYLTEELVKQGHEVTIFASGDSQTSARLIPGCPNSLRVHAEKDDGVIQHLVMAEQVRRHADEFDVLHFHIDFLAYPVMRHLRKPMLSTLHGRLDLPQLLTLYDEFIETPVVSISDSQRKPLPWLNWMGTVHHGLPKSLYRFNPKARGYAAFVGRISPEKRVDRAIEICRRAGMPLKIAAKVGLPDRAYYEAEIKPLIESAPDVEFIGEINDREKDKFIGEASVLLFPIDWPEPFGLVMLEAMACGTPVLAFNNGSVPEVIKDGVNGFIVHNIEEAVKCMDRLDQIKRAACRRCFEERFTAEVMAENYVRLYESMHQDETFMSLPKSRSARRWESWKTSSSITTSSI